MLEGLYKSGKARAIGVSNYNTAHVQELVAAAEVKPMVNQVLYASMLGHVGSLPLCAARHARSASLLNSTRQQQVRTVHEQAHCMALTCAVATMIVKYCSLRYIQSIKRTSCVQRVLQQELLWWRTQAWAVDIC